MAGKAAKTALAIVVAPLVGALAASFPLEVWLRISLISAVERQAVPDPFLFVWQVLFMAAVGSVIALPVSATIGFATHRILTKTGQVSCPNYIIAGGLVGLLSGAALLLAALPNLIGSTSGGNVPLILWGGGIGAIAGAVAWLIRRPDLDNPPSPSSQT